MRTPLYMRQCLLSQMPTTHEIRYVNTSLIMTLHYPLSRQFTIHTLSHQDSSIPGHLNTLGHITVLMRRHPLKRSNHTFTVTDDRIRVEFHVSLLWHALSAVDASNSLRQVPPYVLQVHRLDTVRVMRTATHGNQHCALQ